MKIDKEYGLIIGRFQPPSLHHLQFINQVIKSGIKKLYIGIGDAGFIDDKNIITAKQVESLLIPNLNILNFPYQLKIIPDIHNPPKYAQHIKKYFTNINDSNTCLFTDNTYTSDCFINYGHKFQVITQTIKSIRATDIRQLILNNNPEWQKYVPNNVSSYIKKYQKK